MKLTSSAILAFAFMAAAPASGEEGKKPVYRDAETHDLIVSKLKFTQARDPIKSMIPSEGEDPSVKNKPQDLISSSDAISFNGLTTLVPKRAIIQLPETYADRINNHTPGNKVVGWVEFLTVNRGWVTTVEVSRAQAEGRERLAEELSENLAKSRNLIVATYSSGPISMLPPKEKQEPETQTNPSQP